MWQLLVALGSGAFAFAVITPTVAVLDRKAAKRDARGEGVNHRLPKGRL